MEWGVCVIVAGLTENRSREKQKEKKPRKPTAQLVPEWAQP